MISCLNCIWGAKPLDTFSQVSMLLLAMCSAPHLPELVVAEGDSAEVPR